VLLESDLIARLKNPKLRNRAFEELVDQYQERLYWHIRKIVITHENANDVLQNTFIRIFKGIADFQSRSSLHTWMYRIAYNESIRLLRSNKFDASQAAGDASSYLKTLAEDAYFDGDEMQYKLHEVIAGLPEKQNRVFLMKYFDELSFREISEILEISENTLKSSYYSAVRTIEEKMAASLIQTN